MSRIGEEDPRDPLSPGYRDFWRQGGHLVETTTEVPEPVVALGGTLSYDEHSLLRWIHELSGKLAQSVRAADKATSTTVLAAIDELHTQAQRVVDLTKPGTTDHIAS
ncbi:hypothetical protein [Smaragdicoccus niigatensis]|uniref:hypothetical protein n=1 Tax=Smaragdicoccus niigatensis TaxID=359359 RepID=UPI00036E799D|nr:hypothetical protein [Smaragdicoccus niigatensis]